MSRASTALSRTVSVPLSKTLARTPEDFAALETARSTLVSAAPSAAAILSSMDADKDQIASAKDILDRVGLRAEASSPASEESAMSEVAYGAFRALLSHFGLSVPESAAPRVVEPAIPVVSKIVPKKKRASKGKAKPKDGEDAFLVALEDSP